MTPNTELRAAILGALNIADAERAADGVLPDLRPGSRALLRAARILNGIPAGGWPGTIEAMSQLEDLLPGHWEREYTVGEFIDEAYFIDVAGLYRPVIDSPEASRPWRSFRAQARGTGR